MLSVAYNLLKIAFDPEETMSSRFYPIWKVDDPLLLGEPTCRGQRYVQAKGFKARGEQTASGLDLVL
jgi:hypothetical protein